MSDQKVRTGGRQEQKDTATIIPPLPPLPTLPTSHTSHTSHTDYSLLPTQLENRASGETRF
ncbi:hypothetical protein [Dapis sp. BLCC M229]|uniref:hypothetical protein n=1 Tax=Dapis sp. BLCC M229 TaxID=3400188 RepID=UPI003CF86572